MEVCGQRQACDGGSGCHGVTKVKHPPAGPGYSSTLDSKTNKKQLPCLETCSCEPCFSRQMLPMTPYLSNLEVTYLWQSFHRVQYQSRPHQQHFCNTSRLWSGRNSYCWTVTSSQIVTVQTETERRGPLGRELLVWFGAGAVLVHFGRLLLNSKSIDFVANVKLPVKIFCLFLEGNRLECFSSTFKWHV